MSLKRSNYLQHWSNTTSDDKASHNFLCQMCFKYAFYLDDKWKQNPTSQSLSTELCVAILGYID